MSKTKGNVIDPLDLMNEYGADALRFTLLVVQPRKRSDINAKKVEGNRNFANKLWNTGRFVMNAIDSLRRWTEDGRRSTVHRLDLPDSWIWAVFSS